jgi:hypothetical protein
MTNRMRIEGTDHLLSAGQAVGVRRFVAQSIGLYVRTGGPVKSEEDPLDPPAPRWCPLKDDERLTGIDGWPTQVPR